MILARTAVVKAMRERIALRRFHRWTNSSRGELSLNATPAFRITFRTACSPWREVLWECERPRIAFIPKAIARTINDHIADAGFA
jgi:hypothetical protein